MGTTANLRLTTQVTGSLNWDLPIEANWGLLDSAAGGVTSVALTNLPVTLSGAQYQNNFINFTGTLTGNVTITFPIFGRVYCLQNNCLANTSFTVTCKTSVSSLYVALPPNEPIGVLCDGTDMKFVGLGRVGTYWDFAGSAVPLWVTACAPNPYLNCDGTAFSSATYPALRDYLGAAVLPDARGRFRAALNQGTGRLTGASGTGGINANTLLNTGGAQTIAQGNIPSYNLSATANLDLTSANFVSGYPTLARAGAGSPAEGAAKNLGVTVPSGGSGNAYAPPSYAGGLTLIRAG